MHALSCGPFLLPQAWGCCPGAWMRAPCRCCTWMWAACPGPAMRSASACRWVLTHGSPHPAFLLPSCARQPRWVAPSREARAPPLLALLGLPALLLAWSCSCLCTDMWQPYPGWAASLLQHPCLDSLCCLLPRCLLGCAAVGTGRRCKAAARLHCSVLPASRCLCAAAHPHPRPAPLAGHRSCSRRLCR